MSTPNDSRLPWSTRTPQATGQESVPASAPVYGQLPHPSVPYPSPAPLPPVGWRPGYRQQDQKLGYQRLALADPKHRWFKPLLEALIGVPTYLVISLVLSVALFLPAMMRSFGEQAAAGELTLDATASVSDMAAELQTQALADPLIFALFFGSVALMFPCLWLARIIVGPKPWGLIHSVAGRMRWGWLASCTLIAAIMFAAVPLGSALLLGEPLTHSSSSTATGRTLAILLVLVLLIVPFQAYAEELVFRGYLMQTIGCWLKHPAWAIVLPAPLFMLGHMYDLWAQLSILVMGVAAGYVTWRTGGLEAAIALHVVNNLLAMGLGIVGAADPFVAQGSSVATLISSVITQGLYVLVVVLVAHRRKVEHTRSAQVWVKESNPLKPQPVR